MVSSALGDAVITREGEPVATVTRFCVMPAAAASEEGGPAMTLPWKNWANAYAAATVDNSFTVAVGGTVVPSTAANSTALPLRAIA